jgi:pyruvate formate lyase activating enzyme
MPTESTVRTRHWHRLDEARVQCDICPRACKLRDDQRGLCFVRACQGGEIVLSTYGRSSGFCVDPIEKKPSIISSRARPSSRSARRGAIWRASSARTGTSASRARSTRWATLRRRSGSRSRTRTRMSERRLHVQRPGHLPRVRDRRGRCVPCRGTDERGGHGGYQNAEPRAEFYQHMDAANVDLKGFTERFYHEICAGHLQPVLETLEYLKHETSVWFEITNLVIPGLNDSDQEFDAMTRWIVERLGPMYRFTSPRFTRTGRCSTARRRRRRRSRGLAESRSTTAFATRTPERTRCGRRHDPLSRLQRATHRARLVHAGRVAPNGRRKVPALRDGLRRTVRWRRGNVGREAQSCPDSRDGLTARRESHARTCLGESGRCDGRNH